MYTPSPSSIATNSTNATASASHHGAAAFRQARRFSGIIFLTQAFTHKENSMTDAVTPYIPPRVWSPATQSGGAFANINRPIAGQTHEKELPVGKHPFQLYSLGTPNGQKVTIMFEELLAAGHAGAEYDAWLINIGEGQQFGSGFVDINPNSKIPALLDRSGATPVRLFESGSMLVYLAETAAHERRRTHLPHQPVHRLGARRLFFWQEGAEFFSEVDQHRARFEQAHRRGAAAVEQGRDF